MLISETVMWLKELFDFDWETFVSEGNVKVVLAHVWHSPFKNISVTTN